MSTRRSSSSSSSSQASDIATATPTPAPASSSLKPSIEPGTVNGSGWSYQYVYDSCTYYKADIQDSHGCYIFRSCQSCLEIDGCMVNDFGVCVEARRGMYNLKRFQYDYNLAYNQDMNYRKAVNQNLALPAAASNNAAALTTEQNWHFVAGEVAYCSASDATCQECKQKNFYRGNDTSALPDSRFCVGQNGCVCIQTCEVKTFVDPSCQWVLSSAPSSRSSGDTDYHYYWTKVGPNGWEWALIVVGIVVLSSIFRCCSSSRDRQMEAARKEAVDVVRRELGVPEEEAASTRAAPSTTASPAMV